MFRIIRIKRSQYGSGITKNSEKQKLADHRENGSKPERFFENELKLDLEEGNKQNEQHNYSDIKLNLSADIKNFEALSKYRSKSLTLQLIYR